MLMMILVTILMTVFPGYAVYRIVKNVYHIKHKTNDTEAARGFDMILYIFIFLSCIFGFLLIKSDIQSGNPITIYIDGGNQNYYAALAEKHLLSIITIFVLGGIGYYIINFFYDKLSPIISIISCTVLIINIIFVIVFLVHTLGYVASPITKILSYGLMCIGLLDVLALIKTMNIFVNTNNETSKVYKNRVLNFLYRLSVRYKTMPILFIITLIPILLLVQFVLILFGQQPDSIIQSFLDTSSFRYSQIVPPPPINVEYNAHYLCTVSLRGHEKVVKPVRAGIRNGNRILVNRQLLIANAFENVLEQYTPRLHYYIRSFYDKYGFPLSKYINNSFSADIVYIIMKPLEMIFLIVLYAVDKNPENRINIQYSELRK